MNNDIKVLLEKISHALQFINVDAENHAYDSVRCTVSYLENIIDEFINDKIPNL